MPQAPRTFRQAERKQQREQARPTCTQRGYDGHWSRISRMYRNQYPVCQVCNEAPAADVDHIIPFSGVMDPLRTEWSNLQSICRPCHRLKTEHQSR